MKISDTVLYCGDEVHNDNDVEFIALRLRRTFPFLDIELSVILTRAGTFFLNLDARTISLLNKESYNRETGQVKSDNAVPRN